MERYPEKQRFLIYRALSRNIGEVLTDKGLANDIIMHEQKYVEYKKQFQNDYKQQIANEVSRERNNYINNKGSVRDFFIKCGVELVDDDRKWFLPESAGVRTDIQQHENINNKEDEDINENEDINEDIQTPQTTENDIKTKNSKEEELLYPLVIRYLEKVKYIYSMRINDRTSSGTKGRGGNKWLHPDVVGIQLSFPEDELNNNIKTFARQYTNNSERLLLYSYEVKLKIENIGDAREYFFQTLANSSWANYAYLVAPEYSIDDKARRELNLLMNLHGVGLIELNTREPELSKITVQAQKGDSDLYSINRIYEENPDFRNFISEVENTYNRIGINKDFWNNQLNNLIEKLKRED